MYVSKNRITKLQTEVLLVAHRVYHKGVRHQQSPSCDAEVSFCLVSPILIFPLVGCQIFSLRDADVQLSYRRRRCRFGCLPILFIVFGFSSFNIFASRSVRHDLSIPIFPLQTILLCLQYHIYSYYFHFFDYLLMYAQLKMLVLYFMLLRTNVSWYCSLLLFQQNKT